MSAVSLRSSRVKWSKAWSRLARPSTHACTRALSVEPWGCGPGSSRRSGGWCRVSAGSGAGAAGHEAPRRTAGRTA
jgi:hypothetical protein